MLESSTLLKFLKYMGLLTASLSAVWGIMHDATERDPADGTHLTTAGRATIAITIVALLVSAATTYIGDRIDQSKAYQEALREQKRENEAQLARLAELQRIAQLRQEQRDNEIRREQREATLRQEERDEQARREQRDATSRQEQERREALRQAQATQAIIVAAQPLTTLNVHWEFEKVPPDIVARVEEAQREADDFVESNEDLFTMLHGRVLQAAEMMVHRHQVLYPWITMLGSGKWSDDPALILFSLDSGHSAVLPLGRLSYSEKTSGSAPSVEFVESFETWTRFQPPVDRTRQATFTAGVEASDGTVSMSWDLDANALAQSIDLLSPLVKPLAGLPDRIHVLLLHTIQSFPASPGNFASGLDEFLAERHQYPSPDDYRSMSVLYLQPNNLGGHGSAYEMRLIGTYALDESESEGSTEYCEVVAWEGVRR